LDTFESGTLKAVGYLDGEAVVETERITPGDARAVQLSIDTSGRDPESGQNDVLFVYASIIDQNGTVVPDAESEVFFEVEGDAELIGYNPIKAEAGIATILLKLGESEREITLRAFSDGLGSDEYQVVVN